MTDAEYSSWVSTAYLTPTHADRRLTSSGSTYNVAAETRFYGQCYTIVGKLVYDKRGEFNAENKTQKFGRD